MSITALIITYKRPEMLARTIRSVLNQTYKNVTIVICDDASQDETKNVVESFVDSGMSIEYYCNESNIGAVENYRRSVDHVHTDLFSFVSDDEVLLPNFYEVAVNGFKKYPGASFVSTRVISADENGILCGKSADYFPDGYYRVDNGIVAMSKYSPPIWSGTCFRSSVITEFGGPGAAAALALDHDYFYRIASNNEFYIANEPGVYFPVHSGQASSNLFVDVVFSNRKEIVDEVNNTYKISNDRIRRLVRKNIIRNANNYLLIALALALVNGELDRINRIWELSRSSQFYFIKYYSGVLLFVSRSNYLMNLFMILYKMRGFLGSAPVRQVKSMDRQQFEYVKSLGRA